MIRLVSLGGTGDAYLVSALAAHVRAKHGDDVTIVLKEVQAAIPGMFGLPYDPRPVNEIRDLERDGALHSDYDNQLGPNRIFYAHPCFTRSGVRIDELTTLPHSLSQADMYRALLNLPLDAPLALPTIPTLEPRPNTAVLITEAVSWPNDQPAFWQSLESALRDGGWSVEVPGTSPSLASLFELASAAEMVVGPQCGVMSILCAAEFPCRKVIATPSIDEGPGFLVGRTWLRRTYPYAYVRKFSGEDYDVEEYRIRAETHGEIISTILAAPRTSRDPRPVTTVEMPLTPGDFLDRLAVLTVKVRRGLLLANREANRYAEAFPEKWLRLLAPLVDLHETTFDRLAVDVPDALANPDRDDHDAVTLNRQRVELKRRIDDELRAPYREVKNYF